MAEKPWDGIEDRRKGQEKVIPEGVLGPTYQYDRLTGMDRRHTEHEKRLMKVEAKVNKIEAVQEEHTEILRGIGESFTPLMSVLQGLTDWATVFGYVMQFFRWLIGPVGWKLLVFIVLLVYYIRTGDLPETLRTFLKVFV